MHLQQQQSAHDFPEKRQIKSTKIPRAKFMAASIPNTNCTDNLPYLSIWDISLPGVEGKLPIAYCPICGQKLTEEK